MFININMICVYHSTSSNKKLIYSLRRYLIHYDFYILFILYFIIWIKFKLKNTLSIDKNKDKKNFYLFILTFLIERTSFFPENTGFYHWHGFYPKNVKFCQPC